MKIFVKDAWTVMTMLLFTATTASIALAQTITVRHHPDPNLPNFVGSAPGRGLPGGKDSGIKINASFQLADAGDAASKKGDRQLAGIKYQAALDLWPDNTQALYGLAKCAETNGDLDTAIEFYRTAIYSHDPKVYGTIPGDGYRTNDVARMMEFVLALSQAHQEAEAQRVYKRAAYVLNYQDSRFNGGKPFLRVLLPEFGTGPGQIADTPQRLQAMAHVALSIESSGFDLAVAMHEIQKAVQLYPDSAVVSFYLGERLLSRDVQGAKAAYAKAGQLGDVQVRVAAHRRMNSLP